MARRQQLIVAGIDVGGPRKGFHAVALQGASIASKFRSESPREIAEWCRRHDARIVGVDAPIRWRARGAARAAERELAADGIGCFSTPTARQAKHHPTDYYSWMLNGARLYRALAHEYPRFDGVCCEAAIACFETFPQAIACALAGTIVRARDKRTARPALLQSAGLDCSSLTSIDEVDAALCALTAQCLSRGRIRAYGRQRDGYIVVPSRLIQLSSA